MIVGYDQPARPRSEWIERSRPKAGVGGSIPSGGAIANHVGSGVLLPADKGNTPQLGADLLPAAMTGRASPAKAAVGDKPVFAYIASLPQPQRGIAEGVDALAAKTLPACSAP